MPQTLEAHPPSVVVWYRECLKNHAAATAGFAKDGCGEFMGSDETPESFQCAACKCHRSFHRRMEHPIQPRQQPSWPVSTRSSSVMLAFGGVESTSRYDSRSSMFLSEDKLNDYFPEEEGSGKKKKKRFRMKFTAEQRVKMMEFAERLGWKMSKQEEDDLCRFCVEVGVKRKVFRVWMHNTRQAMKRREGKKLEN